MNAVTQSIYNTEKNPHSWGVGKNHYYETVSFEYDIEIREASMRLAKLVEKYIAEQEWNKEQIQVDVNAGTAKFGTNITISNQSFHLMVESNEERELLLFNLSTPFSVIESKLPDAFLLLNYLNDQKIYRGRLIVNENGNISFKDSIDMQNIEGNIVLIDTILQSGIRVFDDNMDAIASVALTRKTYKAIRKKYDKEFAIENHPYSAKSIQTLTGDIAGEDIMALCFIVMMEASKSAKDDLKTIMDGIKKINKTKDGWRKMQEQCKVAFVELKSDLDDCSELSESEGLRLQMAMDRMSKMMQALSNIEKKISEADSTIINNFK